MTNQLFVICLLTGLVCAFCEYYWIQQGYRSLALVASKCPKNTKKTSLTNNQTTIESMFNWFSFLFNERKDKSIGPIVCETFEIHTDPRSTLVVIKSLCLIGLTLKLISSLKTIPTLIRQRQLPNKKSNYLK